MKHNKPARYNYRALGYQNLDPEDPLPADRTGSIAQVKSKIARSYELLLVAPTPPPMSRLSLWKTSRTRESSAGNPICDAIAESMARSITTRMENSPLAAPVQSKTCASIKRLKNHDSGVSVLCVCLRVFFHGGVAYGWLATPHLCSVASTLLPEASYKP